MSLNNRKLALPHRGKTRKRGKSPPTELRQEPRSAVPWKVRHDSEGTGRNSISKIQETLQLRKVVFFPVALVGASAVKENSDALCRSAVWTTPLEEAAKEILGARTKVPAPPSSRRSPGITCGAHALRVVHMPGYA